MKKVLKSLMLLVLVLMTFTSCASLALAGLRGEDGVDGVDGVDGKDGNDGFCIHAYGEWMMGEEATCCSIGYNYRICNKCDATDYQFIPSSGHQWSEEVMVIYRCDVCNVTKVETEKSEEAKDSDGDGLTDNEEISIYATDPMKADTDGDGASDGKEIRLGFDPLVFDESFKVSYAPEISEDEEPDSVTPSVDVELNGDQVDSLVIVRDDFFDTTTLGYIGDAYHYQVDGSFDSATVKFEFDASALPENALPTIYDYNKAEQTMTPLETTVNGNIASTVVSEFSVFLLLDRRVYENELKWVDKWAVGDGSYTDIEIVFVVDDSGSMSSNDGGNTRLSVARDLIDKLPDGSKIGIVKFESTTYALTNQLIEDKDAAKNYLTTDYFYSSGGTHMYGAISNALSLYESTVESTMRIMVVLSDGVTDDTSMHSSVVDEANAAGVNVYTVGLGDSSSYFIEYLQPLAESTDAAFYLSANAGELAGIYEDIGEKIDLETDTDGDKLCDYYEDNMIVFNGVVYNLDKNNPDTDGDGVADGAEIRTVVIYSMDGTQMTIMGKVYSDPTKTDSDGDGVSDSLDKYPLDARIA